MRRRWSSSLYLAAALLAAEAATAFALVPQEVVVVTNANAAGSVALGEYYCLSRNILKDRMIVLRAPAGPLVSRAEYEKTIRKPIREFLAGNNLEDKIKCLALMWGVPVRVLGSEMTAEQKKLLGAYKVAKDRLHVRISLNLKLAGTIGNAFPQSRTAALRPVGALFARGAAPKPAKGRKFEAFVSELEALIRRKQAAAGKIEDRTRRNIALRQCAALRLDTFGAEQLMAALPPGDVPGVPEKDQIRREIQSLRAERDALMATDETPETARQRAEAILKLEGIVGATNYCEQRMKDIDTAWEDASVDSELAVLWEDDAPARGFRPNPMHWRLSDAKTRPANLPKKIIMTARIDGPTARDALRIIKDSVATEKTGIQGKFYIDAGGRYPQYDVNLKGLAELVEKLTKIPVVLDESKELFARGRCPDAALYVGWYSLQKYVPAFTWSRGAVGWHVASLEAMHLRSPSSDEWCVKMIQNGVTATIGAVNEPFLPHFPRPQEFFSLLLTGRFTLAECYWRTVPTVSWRLTLIGDPLYNPFKLHRQLSIYALPPALTGRPSDDAGSK